jgi:coproporphyrinogen III oxidase-like Fe-S oxidoreductase
MSTQGQAFLASNKLNRYEVSAFAKDNQASKHNLNYWQFGDYIGVGAGAHSKITDLTTKAIYRWQKTRLPKDYGAQSFDKLASPRKSFRELSLDDEYLEILMNGLRLTQGIHQDHWLNHTKLNPVQWQKTREKLAKFQVLATTSDTRIQLTPAGFDHLDTVLGALHRLSIH